MKNLIVYKSSAGSGKTTTLVSDYLKITIPNPDKFKSVVGLTFTIKATAEMKNRVLEVLSLIDDGDYADGDLVSRLMGEIATQNGKDLDWVTENSRILLAKILHNYSYFSFSTIDSFVLNVVRSFAYDLRLPTKFDIELEVDTIIDLALARLFSRVGDDELLTSFMLDYVMSQLDDEKSVNIEIGISELSRMIFNQANFRHLVEISKNSLDQIAKFRNDLLAEKSSMEAQLTAFGNAGFAIVDQAAIPYDSFSYSYQGGLYSFFNKLRNLYDIDNLFTTRVFQTFEEGKMLKKSASPELISMVESIRTTLDELYWKIKNFMLENGPRYASIRIILLSIGPFALLNQVNKHVQEIYAEEGMIHLSESTKRVAEIVAKESMPFIFERIGNVYENYFIDEFQDTSTVQWGNLIPLVENSLASGNKNLVVGDAKQSIYRWNGGEVQQFVGLPDISKADLGNFNARGKVFSDNYEFKNLDSNYRSASNIVKFNNLFFEAYKSKMPDYVKDIYAGHQQVVKRGNKGGVSLTFHAKTEEEKCFESIYNRVKEVESRGHSLGDIVILARKNKELSQIASFLLSVDPAMKIVSGESLYVKSSKKVSLIINALYFIHDGSVDIYKVGLLTSLLQNNDLGKQFGPLWAGFKKVENIDDVNHFLELNELGIGFGQFELNTVFGIISSIISSFGLLDSDDPFVSSFIDFVLTYQTRNSSSLIDFLEFWELKKDNLFINLPEGGNALRLMTIHKSKGLQFPIVIYFSPDSRSVTEKTWVEVAGKFETQVVKMVVNHTSLMQGSYFASDYQDLLVKQQADAINAHYVAMTRPKNELHVVLLRENSFVDSLKEFVKSENLDFKEDSSNSFSLGEFNVVPNSVEIARENILREVKKVGWTGRLNLRLSEGDPNKIGLQDKREEGIYLHYCLSKIVDISRLTFVLSQIDADFNISDSRKIAFKRKIEKVVNHPDIGKYFGVGSKVFMEKSINYLGNTYRPDRVVWMDGIITVIDYKFADLKEVRDDLLSKYFSQIHEYCSIISKIEGCETKGAIVFVGEEINQITHSI